MELISSGVSRRVSQCCLTCSGESLGLKRQEGPLWARARGGVANQLPRRRQWCLPPSLQLPSVALSKTIGQVAVVSALVVGGGSDGGVGLSHGGEGPR